MTKVHHHAEQFDDAMHPWCGRGSTAVQTEVFEATDPAKRCRICDRDWFPGGQPAHHLKQAQQRQQHMTTTLTPGHIYHVSSTRKGKFTGKLISACDTWATLEITSGRAGAMLPENVRERGEEVTVRREWCTFTEAPTDPVTAYYTDRANGAHAAKAP